MAARKQLSATVDVARPPEDVFAYLADVRRHAEWSPRDYRVEGLGEADPVMVGTTYTSIGWLPNDKQHRNEVTVAEMTPPTRLVLASEDHGETFYNTFTLTKTDSGTRVERVLDLPVPPGVNGMLLPVIGALLIKPDLRKGLANLRSQVEGRAATG